MQIEELKTAQTSWSAGGMSAAQMKVQCEAYSDFTGQFCEVLLCVRA